MHSNLSSDFSKPCTSVLVYRANYDVTQTADLTWDEPNVNELSLMFSLISSRFVTRDVLRGTLV